MCSYSLLQIILSLRDYHVSSITKNKTCDKNYFKNDVQLSTYMIHIDNKRYLYVH